MYFVYFDPSNVYLHTDKAGHKKKRKKEKEKKKTP